MFLLTQKHFVSISLLSCLFLFSINIKAQIRYPDGYGEKMKYEAVIGMKKGYISGICFLSNEGDEVKASLFNEFGISALDFSYYPSKDKIKLHSVVSFLDKWYIKRILRSDLVRLFHQLQLGGGEYHNSRYKIYYKLKALNDDFEE